MGFVVFGSLINTTGRRRADVVLIISQCNNDVDGYRRSKVAKTRRSLVDLLDKYR